MSQLREAGARPCGRYHFRDRRLHIRGAGASVRGLRGGIHPRGGESADDSGRTPTRDLGRAAQVAAQTLAEWARDGPADSDGHRAQPPATGRRGGPRLEGGEEDHHRAEPLAEAGSVPWTREGSAVDPDSGAAAEGERRYHRTMRQVNAAPTIPIPRQPANSRKAASTIRKPTAPATKAKRCRAHLEGSSEVRRTRSIAPRSTAAPSRIVTIGIIPKNGPPP